MRLWAGLGRFYAPRQKAPLPRVTVYADSAGNRTKIPAGKRGSFMTERMGVLSSDGRCLQPSPLAARAMLRPAARRLAAVGIGFAGGWAVLYGALMPFGLGLTLGLAEDCFAPCAAGAALGLLLHTATIDLHFDKPVEVSVLMCETKSDLELFNEAAAIQPMDEHPLRGTFEAADWNYTLKKPVNAPEKPLMLELATSQEGYAKGVDATTGLPAENYGNYGVIYKVNFTVTGKKPISFILNPIGGPFAGYGVLENKTKGERQLLALPESTVCVGTKIEEAIELGKLKAGEYSFIWSPPGASNLPVQLIWEKTE